MMLDEVLKDFPDRLIVQHVKQQTCFIGLLALLAGESKSIVIV